MASIFMGYFSSLVFRGMMWYMRTLQLIIHLPLLQIVNPANVAVFFNALVPAVTFDIIENEWTSQLILEFDEEKEREAATTIID